MAWRTFTALLMAASAWLAAGSAPAQELKVRPGTGSVEGPPGSLQDVPAPAPILGPRLAPGFSPPRFNGKPDFTGVWNNETLTGVNRPPERLVCVVDVHVHEPGERRSLVCR